MDFPSLAKDDIFAKLDGILARFSAKYNSTAKNLNANDLQTLSTSIDQIKLCIDKHEVDLKLHVITAKSSGPPPIPFNQIASPTVKQIIEKRQSTIEKTIIVSAIANQNVNELANKVENCVKKMRNEKINIKINHIYKGKTSSIVKIPANENVDDLIKAFKNFDDLNSVSRIYEARKKDPIVVIKAVSKITPASAIIDEICSMNEELNDKQKGMKMLFETRSYRQDRDIILRVAPAIYKIFKKLGSVYTELQCCYVHDKVLVNQCQKCMTYNPNHRTKDCQGNQACKDCNEVGVHSCTKNNNCTNCFAHPRYKNDCKHKPNSKDCPIYKREMNKLIENTDYTSNVDTIFSPLHQ